jgi:hypothetical protein
MTIVAVAVLSELPDAEVALIVDAVDQPISGGAARQ